MKSRTKEQETPNGFSLTTNSVPEQVWEEIKLYLGLDTEKQNLGIDLTTCRNNENIYIPWETTPHPQNRLVAQFGFRYNYEKDIVEAPYNTGDESNGDTTGPSVKKRGVPRIPQLFHDLLIQPLQKSHGRFDSFTQSIVNVYCPTQHHQNELFHNQQKKEKQHIMMSTSTSGSYIPWHVDNPKFGPRILVYTFGETRPLHMRLKCNHSTLQSNSSSNEIVTTNSNEHNVGKESFTYYTAYPPHCSYYVLSEEARHEWEHSVPAGSGWRVSITFRTLNTGKGIY